MQTLVELVDIALKEDIGSGDITTEPLVDPESIGRGVIIAKEPLVLAGIEAAVKVFERLEPEMTFNFIAEDGGQHNAGDRLMEITGKVHALLMGERTALNFIQRLSGIATLVRSYVDRIKDCPVRLVDTRKTTPGWRILEKYAVRVGGASNHRMGLYDGVLIKDNHIAACGGIDEAVARIRKRISHLVKIEVETATMEQVEEAISAGVDVIMLDNMTPDAIREAVQFIGGRALVEISGGVTLSDLEVLAETGADIISVGALTHSARAVDISMRISSETE